MTQIDNKIEQINLFKHEFGAIGSKPNTISPQSSTASENGFELETNNLEKTNENGKKAYRVFVGNQDR